MRRLEGSSPQRVTVVTIGGVLLILASVQETYAKKKLALTPARLKTRTTSILFLVIFSHTLVLTGAYYLPLCFQVLGSSATGAGIR